MRWGRRRALAWLVTSRCAPGTHRSGARMTTMKDRLLLGSEFRPEEHDRYRELVFGNLERRLKRWQPEQVELELSVSGRETNAQRTELVCRIVGVPTIASTSPLPDLDKAVVEVRNDVRRQVNRWLTRKEAERRR